MTHYMKQVQEGYDLVTYIYSTVVDCGTPVGFVRAKFLNGEQLIDDNGRVYRFHRFHRWKRKEMLCHYK